MAWNGKSDLTLSLCDGTTECAHYEDMSMDESVKAQFEKPQSVELDPASWVDLYGDYLYRYAVTRLRDSESSEEVVQETFLAALRHVDQYQGRGAERAWLLGILKRKIVDFIRSRKREATAPMEATNDIADAFFDQNGHWLKQIQSAGYRPLDALEKEEFWQVLRRCLQSLPIRHADVFTLREMDEKSTQEICKELDITPSNLWVILYRARLQLSSCMKSRWHQDQT